MEIDNDNKELATKKMRTVDTLMTEASQTSFLEENNENKFANSGESPETPTNLAMTSSDPSIKTKQKILPGPESAPRIFSHDNPYVNHGTTTTTQQTDQLTCPNQPPPMESELILTPDPTSQDNNNEPATPFFTEDMFFDFDVPTAGPHFLLKSTIDDLQNADMEITSDITVESEPEPPQSTDTKITTTELAKLTYSAITSGKGKSDNSYRRTPRRETLHEWKDQVEKKLTEMQQDERVENFDEETWHTDKIMEILGSLDNLTAFIKYKLNTNPTDIQIPPAINTKLQHKDTAFFHSFTRTASAQAPHQIEFSTLLNKAIDRYKRLHNIPMTKK